MTVYATLSDISSAIAIYEHLLGQNARLDELSLVSQDRDQSERADSLAIPNFGRVWGLGHLSQSSVVSAAISGDGMLGLELALQGLPEQLAAQLRKGYQGGQALIEVSVEGPLERMALAALLSTYGAFVLN